MIQCWVTLSTGNLYSPIYVIYTVLSLYIINIYIYHYISMQSPVKSAIALNQNRPVPDVRINTATSMRALASRLYGSIQSTKPARAGNPRPLDESAAVRLRDGATIGGDVEKITSAKPVSCRPEPHLRSARRIWNQRALHLPLPFPRPHCPCPSLLPSPRPRCWSCPWPALQSP